MSPLIVPQLPSDLGIILPIIDQDSKTTKTNNAEDALKNMNETEAQWEDWAYRDMLENNLLRPADGIVTSTYIVPLNEFAKVPTTIQRTVSNLIARSKEFNIDAEENPYLNEVRFQYTKLRNKLQTLCSHKESVRDKRFAGIIVFAIFALIAVVGGIGIAQAIGNSNRLVDKEDISIGLNASIERRELERIEIERARKNAERLDALEHRMDNMEHEYKINKFAKKMIHTIENENKELDFITDPKSYTFESSVIMERMAFDILNFFSNKSDDLFDHVVGTGITEMLYFSTTSTIILQSESSNSCEDAFAMIVAKTIIPNRNVVGKPTQDPQKYETDDGRFMYIADAYMLEGSKFRPSRSLSSQRLVMSSSNISVTVLNNTVFAIDNKGLHLDIVIRCPGKPYTQETLYNAPFLRLHTSCEISSEHLNISSFSKDYIHDEIAVSLDIYDLEDEERDFNIGYHKTPIDNKHDITEMFEMADDIFQKETEILQHEMKRLENTFSLGKLFEKVGNTVSGWFKNSLHAIVGVICVVLGSICGVMLLVILFKCCKKYEGYKQ